MEQERQLTTYQKQKLTKPLVEDMLPDVLDGEILTTAQDFVAHLRSSRIKPSWVLINQWKAMYKGRCICKIIIRQDCWKNPDKWIVAAWLENISQYEDILIAEGLDKLVQDNIYYCVQKPEGSPAGDKIQHALTYPCNLWGCAPGKTVNLCGKELTNCCCNGNRQYYWVHNPTIEDLRGLKRVIELEQGIRDAAAAAKKKAK